QQRPLCGGDGRRALGGLGGMGGILPGREHALLRDTNGGGNDSLLHIIGRGNLSAPPVRGLSTGGKLSSLPLNVGQAGKTAPRGPAGRLLSKSCAAAVSDEKIHETIRRRVDRVWHGRHGGGAAAAGAGAAAGGAGGPAVAAAPRRRQGPVQAARRRGAA